MGERSSWITPLRLGLAGYGILVVASFLFQQLDDAAQTAHALFPATDSTDVWLSSAYGSESFTYVVKYWQGGVVSSKAQPPVVVLAAGIGREERARSRALVDHLATTRHVLVPQWIDLVEISPEDGRGVGRMLSKWLDTQGIARAHVVGTGVGGEIAMHLYAADSTRASSLVLHRSRGVSELELLGQPTLNEGLYAMQAAVLTLLNFGIPHFGAWQRLEAWRVRADLYRRLDLRPLRNTLATVAQPTLLVYPSGDLRIRPTVALEVHRIVPQSRLEWTKPNERNLQNGSPVGTRVAAFVAAVEQGRAAGREHAEAARIEAAQRPYDRGALPPMGGTYLVLFMTIIALATLVSEDLTCIASGLLVAQKSLAFVPAVTACFLGIFIGDMLLYAAGRWVGRPVVRMRPWSWMVSAEDLERGKRWLQNSGTSVIIASRFVPGSRLPTYVAAGVLGANALWFALLLAGAAAVWTPILVGLAVVLGQQVLQVVPVFEAYALPVLLAAALALLLFVRTVVPLFTYKGRRLLYGRWCRWTRWEFWPPYVVYPPLFVYIAYLMIRYRGITVCTAANPGMPHGGFAGESKAAILSELEAAGDAVARWVCIDAATPTKEALETIRTFQQRLEFEWPLVLKPDTGERGQGVQIVRSEQEAAGVLQHAKKPMIVQEYVGGREYGVFYYRFPSKASGHVFSITDKRFPVVHGDGISPLERLILRDPRAVCMAPLHLRQHADELDRVLEAGEPFELVRLGTHARGSVFLDGTHLRTPELERAMDTISRSFEGFYFGRYDIRVASEEALQQGKGMRVLELNGVTSESTNIYDPSHSLWYAYRTLARQWRLAFAIGAANRERGVRPSRIRDVLRSTLDHFRNAD